MIGTIAYNHCVLKPMYINHACKENTKKNYHSADGMNPAFLKEKVDRFFVSLDIERWIEDDFQAFLFIHRYLCFIVTVETLLPLLCQVQIQPNFLRHIFVVTKSKSTLTG
jgi:hypothetical protein